MLSASYAMTPAHLQKLKRRRVMLSERQAIGGRGTELSSSPTDYAPLDVLGAAATFRSLPAPARRPPGGHDAVNRGATAFSADGAESLAAFFVIKNGIEVREKENRIKGDA